jgi:hypothetical protein
MIIFRRTTKVFVRDRSTGEQYLCKNKGVLRDLLNIPRDTIMGWFRVRDGIKPKHKIYNNLEIFEIDGEYRTQRKSDINIQKQRNL